MSAPSPGRDDDDRLDAAASGEQGARAVLAAAAGRLRQRGVPVTTITRDGQDEAVLVPVEAYLRLERERDDYRRALALINAWRLPAGRDDVVLDRLLTGAGFDVAQARTMQGLIAQVRGGALLG